MPPASSMSAWRFTRAACSSLRFSFSLSAIFANDGVGATSSSAISLTRGPSARSKESGGCIGTSQPLKLGSRKQQTHTESPTTTKQKTEEEGERITITLGASDASPAHRAGDPSRAPLHGGRRRGLRERGPRWVP